MSSFQERRTGSSMPLVRTGKREKKKRERKKGREKDTEFFVRLGSDIRRLDSSRPVRRLPTRDTSARLFLPMTHRASEISFPGMTTGGGRGGLEKKKTGRVSLTDLSRYRVAQILFKKKKKEKTIHDGKNRLRFGRIDVTS